MYFNNKMYPNTIGTKVTGETYVDIHQIAKELGISVSEWVREALHKGIQNYKSKASPVKEKNHISCRTSDGFPASLPENNMMRIHAQTEALGNVLWFAIWAMGQLRK